MAVSRRTWCRVCGTELRLPQWKALIGLNVGYCDDQHACLARFHAQRTGTRRKPDLEPAPAPETHPAWRKVLHRIAS